MTIYVIERDERDSNGPLTDIAKFESYEEAFKAWEEYAIPEGDTVLWLVLRKSDYAGLEDSEVMDCKCR